MNKFAIIGTGPAGIEAAATLAAHHNEVDIYEQENAPLGNIRDKAFLFPNFADADEVAGRLLARLDHPLIHLYTDKGIDQLEETPDGGWSVNGNTYSRVLLATGYRTFDAGRKEELGYGIYRGIRSSLEMEQMLREQKITNANGDKPQRIVFLQCVGSRDEKTGNLYCSKLCCVTAVKQAIETRKLLPDAEIFIFYMDLRMWGQHYEELYRQAQQEYGIRFVRGRISEAGGTYDGRVQIKSEDTLMGLPLKITTDLLVLMVGMEPSEGTRRLAGQCHICGDYGFAQSIDPHTDDNRTAHRGLYVAGACKRPMTLTDAIADGRSAAVVMLAEG
ncbi:MAG: Uncharacterized protein AUK63_1355 [bacterium P3]|nr:MAG: Uncharacterized protein AUK63_1355 [bacterium P3]KWW40152.1 MAG: Uncharacterized protein F083_1874 [bacterium F083]